MTPLQQIIERNELRKMKLKDTRYYIKGIDSDKPLYQCLQAIVLGMAFPLALAIVIRIVDYLITGK